MSESGTKVDAELQTNLKRAQKAPSDKPLFFALVVKGTSDGKLIVSKRKIPEKQVGEAKKATGGTTVVKGVCFGEDGQLVFETVKPPAPSWAVVAKKLAKDTTGLMIKPVFKQGRDDEAVSESADEPEAGEAPTARAPTTEPDPAAAWQRRVAEVSARVKAAAGAKHPAARDMILGVSQAQAYFRGGHTADAEARLREVEALLGPAPDKADPAAEFKARLAEWTPAIKAALVAKGPNAAAIGKLLAQATALSKPDGDMAQALEKLTECHALATAGTAPGGEPKQAEGGKVAFAKSKLQWEQAKKAVKQQLADLEKTIVEDFNDPESLKAVKKLDRVLNRFNEGLGDTLDDLYNAAADKEPPLRGKATEIVEHYLDYLANDALVQHVQDNPFAKVTVQNLLELPLKNLKTRLAKSFHGPRKSPKASRASSATCFSSPCSRGRCWPCRRTSP